MYNILNKPIFDNQCVMLGDYIMSQEEARIIIEKLKEHTDESTSSAEKALATLLAAGLIKKDGTPAKPYNV